MISSDHLVILGCLILSAFFSGIEIAYVSSNPIFLAIEERRKGLYSRAMHMISKNSSRFIVSLLLGNNIVLVIYGLFMGREVVRWLLPESLDADLSFSIVFYQTLISTVIILFSAEFFPKIFSRLYAEKVLKFSVWPSIFFYYLFYPFTFLLMVFTDIILVRLFGTKNDQVPNSFSKIELGSYIEEQVESLDRTKLDSEIEIFQNALQFSSIKAREVMIPRTELIAIEKNGLVSELLKKFIQSGRSKILVFDDNIDKILGYVHAFEMFSGENEISKIVRNIDFVPETMYINEVLKLLNRTRRSIAVVSDEYGLTSGIITIEDIIEELFGEIEDEHDESLHHKQLKEGKYELSARLEVDFINKQYGLNLPESSNYETLGGFLAYQLGDIPSENQKIEIGNYEFLIKKGTDKKIDIIILTYGKH